MRVQLAETADRELSVHRRQRLNIRVEPSNQLDVRQELQLRCDCCGQPYHPDKGWQDRLEAVLLGTERYAICPVCAQVPPQSVLSNPVYRKRCQLEVRRLQRQYENWQRQVKAQAKQRRG